MKTEDYHRSGWLIFLVFKTAYFQSECGKVPVFDVEKMDES